jgi:hypothetical protein
MSNENLCDHLDCDGATEGHFYERPGEPTDCVRCNAHRPPLSLADCVNWTTNVQGDCAGEIIERFGVLECRTCRQRLDDRALMQRERFYLESRLGKHEAAMHEALGEARYAKMRERGGWYSGDEALIIEAKAPFSNEQRSRLECLRLWLDTPDRFVAYVGQGGFTGAVVSVKTWVGERIADAREGRRYRQRGFGGVTLLRVPVRVDMGGRVYVGTWTPNAGDYVSLRATKPSKPRAA